MVNSMIYHLILEMCGASSRLHQGVGFILLNGSDRKSLSCHVSLLKHLLIKFLIVSREWAGEFTMGRFDFFFFFPLLNQDLIYRPFQILWFSLPYLKIPQYEGNFRFPWLPWFSQMCEICEWKSFSNNTRALITITYRLSSLILGNL